MKKTVFILILFFIGCPALHAQGPKVPSTMGFAGLKLHISKGARKQIQSDVNALRRYDKYFRKKLKKVNLYFPIIERVFRQENLPEDFKYLVIQESALIPDAVSSSNAVGFWQFKKGTALEMGLRVDHQVDERLNIVSSSVAAAQYLKKNNMHFDNWVYALLAYNTGAGGAQRYVDKRYFGKGSIDITRRTHWYVKKFLAHKVAFEKELNKDEDEQPFFLYEYTKTKGKTLKAIAREFEVDPELLYDYNVCFKRKKVPSDKKYAVVIPIGYDKAQKLAKKNNEVYKPVKMEKKSSGSSFLSIIGQGTHVKPYYSERDKFPKINKTSTKDLFDINGKEGTIADPGDRFKDMAKLGGISLKKFKKYNDLTSYDNPQSGQVYYFERKYSKARTHYHTLLPGETLWEVSQKYALKLKKLLSKNRLKDETEADPGLVLWLRFIRPRNVEPEYRNVDDLFVKKGGKKNTPSEDSKKYTNTETKNNSTPQKNNKEDITTHESSNKASDTPEDVNTTIDQQPDENEAKSTDNIPDDANKFNKKTTIHYVKKGDTYFNIAEKYNIEIPDLLEWNDLHINDVLSVGQKLKVSPEAEKEAHLQANTRINPQPSGAEDKNFVVHNVTEEETLYSIARKYKVTIKDIMEWNDKEDFVIQTGEKLKIYNQ